MGLKEFEEVEIRSVVMGVDVIITQKIIAKLFGVSITGRSILNTKESSPEADVIKEICLSCRKIQVLLQTMEWLRT